MKWFAMAILGLMLSHCSAWNLSGDYAQDFLDRHGAQYVIKGDRVYGR
jgi:hypothetical protein